MNRLAMSLALASFIACATASRAWSADGRTISDPMTASPSDTLGVFSRLHSRDAGGRRHVSFVPARLAQCDYFIVAESGLSELNVRANDWLDDHILRNSLEVMKNVGPSRSMGASVDAHWAVGTITVTPTVRLRQWMGRRQSVEASFGYIRNNREGLVGPIASIRYSPVPPVFVEAGVCQLQAEWQPYDLRTQRGRFEAPKSKHVFGGIGLTGGGGVAVWGGELVALGVLVVMLAGMSD